MDQIIETVNAVKYLKDENGEPMRDRVGGYLVRFTGPDAPDLYDEYFTADTELAEDVYPIIPLMYQHGFDPVLRHHPIGRIDKMVKDVNGLWVEAQLDMHHEYMESIQRLIDHAVLGWSSGAWPQAVAVDSDGWIKRWPVIEGSLTPTPAEPTTVGDVAYQRSFEVRETGGSLIYDCQIDAAKAAFKSIGIDFPGSLEVANATESDAAKEADGGHDIGAPTEENIQPEKEPMKMAEMTIDPAVLDDAVDAALKRRDEKVAQAELEAKAAKAEELEQRLAELEVKSAQDEEDNTPAKRLPGRKEAPQSDAPRIRVSSKFDNLTAADMGYGYMVLKATGGVSEEYSKALADKVQREGITLPYAVKADELDYSTQSGYGDEWVPDMWSSELWRKARQDNVIMPLFRQIEMPSNPYELPIQGADPTVYYSGESTDEADLSLGSGNPTPDSKIGTGKVQLSAKKLSLRVGFSRELVEDSIIPILPTFREQAIRAMADAFDNVLLNGDTTNAGTGNINLDDADPADTKPYLIFDGLRHLPLVTTTANAVDAAGAPTLALLRSARATMAAKYAYKPSELAWIVDFSTYMKLLSLDEVVTVDKYGPNATVMTGELAKVDGIPVLVSDQMGLTEADGKISDTGSNNTKGQGVLVYRPGWVVGWRRRVMATAKYFEEYDAYQLFAHARIAFNRYDADVAACLYDITV